MPPPHVPSPTALPVRMLSLTPLTPWQDQVERAAKIAQHHFLEVEESLILREATEIGLRELERQVFLVKAAYADSNQR